MGAPGGYPDLVCRLHMGIDLRVAVAEGWAVYGGGRSTTVMENSVQTANIYAWKRLGLFQANSLSLARFTIGSDGMDLVGRLGGSVLISHDPSEFVSAPSRF